MHDELARVDRVIDGREAGRVPEGWATSHRGDTSDSHAVCASSAWARSEPSTKSGHEDAGVPDLGVARAAPHGRRGHGSASPRRGSVRPARRVQGHRRSVGAPGGRHGWQAWTSLSTTEDPTAEWSGAHSRSRHRSAPSRDASGLVAAVVQQHDTLEVLMLGWMDDEALRRTLTTGRVTFWSRSRQSTGARGHQRSRPMGALGRARLRRRRPARHRRAGRCGLSHRCPDLFRGP